MTRIPDEDLAVVRDLFGRLQDNITDADAKAQAAFDSASGATAAAREAADSAALAASDAQTAAGRASAALTAAGDAVTTASSAANALTLLDQRVRVVETRASGAGGLGPNAMAAPNSPSDLQRAVAAGGGVVCTATNAASVLQTLWDTYGQVVAVQGDYTITKQVSAPQRRSLVGWNASTNFVGGPGLSGAMFYTEADHTHWSDFAMSGGSEAAGTHHLHVNSTTKSNFWTGSESTTFVRNLVSRNAKGDAIRFTGSFNRDGKILQCHIYNPTGSGVYIGCPDGMISLVTVGTPNVPGSGAGGYGFWFDTGAANWEADLLKAWYCEKDGLLLNGVRNGYSRIQAQDNRFAGIRLLGGTECELNGFHCDSNSLNSASPTPGLHSGLEVGLLPATAVGTPGAASGGIDWIVTNGRCYDKNEGQRGFNQRYGVLVGPVTGLIMDAIHTGRAGGTHRNQTDGIAFTSPSTRTNSANSFSNLRSHGVLV